MKQRWVPPSGTTSGYCQSLLCTPGDGQHIHIYTTQSSTCHDDHSDDDCPTGQHLNGHDTCHDHTCPSGQHQAPFPKLRVYRSGAVDVFTTALKVSVPVFGALPWSAIARLAARTAGIDTVAVEWVEVDSHTGCHSPRFPIAERLRTLVDTATVDWDRVSSSTVATVQSALNDVNLDVEGVGDFVIDTNRSYLELQSKVTAKATDVTHKTLYIFLCVPEAELARGILERTPFPSAFVLASAKAAKLSQKARRLLVAGGAAGVTIGVTVEIADYVICNYTENPWADGTATTTRPPTTTTRPPTTTTRPPTTTTTLPEIEDSWRAYDSNSNGCVDRREWLVAISDYTAVKLSTATVVKVAANRCR